MTKNQLKALVLIGTFIIPFIPLVVTKSLFFPFITGKAFIFRVIVEIIFAAWIILCIKDESYRPKFSWILGAIATFLVIIGVADFLGENSFKSFWSNFERMEGYITMLHLGAYFLVLGSVLKTQELWNRLLATNLGVSVVMAIYSFLQLAGKITINQGGVRVDGTFGNAGYLGIYMVFHIFFAALLLFRFRYTWQRVTLGVIALIDMIILYFTATRGAILGLLGGALITFLFLVFKSEKKDKIRKVGAAGLVALVVLAGLFFAVRNNPAVKNNPVLGRFASLSFSEIQTQGRYFVWPIAIKGVEERPLLGWGQEGFNFVFNKYYDARMYTQEAWFDRAHSTPLDWLVAGGILGLVSYLSVFVAVLFYVFKSQNENLSKEEKAVLLGLVSAYFFNNLFVFDQIGSYISFFLVLAYMHAHAPETSQKLWDKLSSKVRNIFEREKWQPITEAGAVIILILVLYFGNYIPWRENKNLLEVLRLGNQGQVGTIEAYSKPLSKYSIAFPEGLEHISQAVTNLAGNQSASAELKQQTFELVDRSFQTQLERVPNDARYRLFYGLFLSRFGWYGRALEQLEEARKLSPNKQQILFEMVNNLIPENRGAEALQIAKTAYELEPNFEEAKLLYGYTALATGDINLSNQILGQFEESRIIFDDRYLSILLSLKQYEKIIEVAKRRIELDSANLQHRITLTAAYLQANRREDAVKTLQELIVLEPSFKEQGELYINEIRAGRNP